MEPADAMETYPAWVGQLLKAALPAGERPLAMYYSWTHDVRAVPAVVVLPTALIGVEMTFGDHSQQALNVSVAAVPMHRVASVRLASRAWLGADPDAAVQNVEIEIMTSSRRSGPRSACRSRGTTTGAMPTSRARSRAGSPMC